MNREESTSDRSKQKRLQTGNVIRLPQGWVGPPDRLVPFGPSATGAPNAPASPPTDSTGPGPTPDPFTPQSAQSFWTADSAALHAPIEAPTPAPVPPVDAPIQTRPAGSHPDPPGERRSRLPGKRTGAVITTGLMLIAVIVASATGARSSHHPAAHAHESAALSPRITFSATIEHTVTAISAALQKPVNAAIAHPRTVAHAKRTARAHPPAVKARRRRRSREPAPGRARVSAPAAPAASTAAESSGTLSGQATTAPEPVATGGPSNSTSSSSSASRQPAFGQDGSLGPGSSRASH